MVGLMLSRERCRKTFDDRSKVSDMLRITIQATSHGTTLKVEGKLTSPWVQKLERLWERVRDHALHHELRVDLTSILFLDAEGKRIVRQMHDDGAELTMEASQAKPFVEEGAGLKTTIEGSKRRRNIKVRRKRVDRHLQQSTFKL